MKKTITFIMVLAMLLSLCACGATSDKGSQAAAPAAMEAPRYESASYSMDMAAAEETEAGGFAVNSAKMDVADSASENESQRPDKIIYSADATVETTDFDGTIAGISSMMEQCGGWIESSSVNGSNYYNMSRGRVSSRSAHYALRVPSESFTEIMSGLSRLGNVPYSHTYTENISSQYYDTEARLTAYETQEQRLLEMMEIAESVEDVITIEEKLTELRYKIESLQTSLKNWDRQVSYSSIYLTVEEVEEYTPEASVQPSYGEKLMDSLESGVAGFVGFMGDLFIALVGALPALLALGTLAAGVYAIVKRRRVRQSKTDAGEKTEGEKK